MLVWVFFSPTVPVWGVYTFLKKTPVTPNQNLLHPQKRSFHLLILLCKCYNEHIAEKNETIKREVLFFLIHWANQCFTLQTHQAPDGHVYKDLYGHFIWNDKLSTLHNEVSEASRKEMYNLVAWVCKHSPAEAI